MQIFWLLCIGGVAFIVIPALISGLLSLIAWLSPIRRLGQDNLPLQQLKWLLFCIVAFVVVFGFYTLFWVDILIDETINPSAGPCFNCADVNPDEFNQHNQLIRLELWIRTILPPVLSDECFIAETEVCQVATRIIHRTPLDWEIYMLIVLSGIASATGSYLSVRRLDQRLF